MEEPMSEQGQKENREKDRQQDLLGNSLYAFGVHGAMPQEAAVGVKKIIAVRVEECKSSRVKE
jgi:hypothetical protein